MKYFKKHSHLLILLFILIFAFFPRFLFFSQEGFVTTDGVSYLLPGKNLVENGKYEIFGNPQILFPPGYSIAVGIADIFFNDLVFSARFISFIAGLFSIYFFYLIGKELCNKKTGLFASFFAATHWMFMIMSQEVLSESLYIFFVLITIYLYLKLTKKYNSFSAILLGLSIGITYLIRPEGIVFVSLAIFFLFQKQNGLKLKKAIAGSLIVVSTFLIVIAPYFYFLYQNTGELSLTTKSKLNLIAGIIVDGKELRKINKDDAIFYEKTFSNYDEETNSMKLPEEFADTTLKKHILNDPINFLKRYKKGFLSEIETLVNEHSANIFLIPVIILFVFAFKTKKLLKEIFLLLFFPVIFLFIFPIFHIESRYLLQIMIFIILLSSLGLSMKNKMTLRIKGFEFSSALFLKILRLLIIIIILLNFIAYCYCACNSYGDKNHPIEHKLAGEHIKNDSDYNPEKSIIMSRKPFVVFYAENKAGKVAIPYTNLDNIIKFAKKKNVDYIIVDQRYLGIRENYNEIVKMNEYFNDIELFYEDNSIQSIKVFKILKNEQ